MPNHPNRSRFRTPASRPPAEAIAAARRAMSLTQKEAAAVIYSTERAWQAWEQDERPMHPGLWELFQLKTGDGKTLKRLGLTKAQNDDAAGYSLSGTMVSTPPQET